MKSIPSKPRKKRADRCVKKCISMPLSVYQSAKRAAAKMAGGRRLKHGAFSQYAVSLFRQDTEVKATAPAA